MSPYVFVLIGRFQGWAIRSVVADARHAASIRDSVPGAGSHMQRTRRSQETNPMLETIAAVLLLLWILGLVSSFTLGGFIHVLLVLAVVVILVRVIQGRRIAA